MGSFRTDSEIARSLANNRVVSQGPHDRAVGRLGYPGGSNAITPVGYYTAVSLTMNVLSRTSRNQEA
jgi:hypothetical protein